MSSHKGVMRQVVEKYPVNETDLIVWSNKIDLLALSNSKGEVSLHRLNFQKVWTLPPPAEDIGVIALSWRPDGRVLVISYNKEVHVVDIEKKTIVHKIVTEHEICFMHWTQESLNNPNKYEGYLRLMGDAESSCKLNLCAPSKESAELSIENFRNIKIYSHLNFLLIALKTGEVQVHVFGLFCCGIINLKEYLPVGIECTVLSADITQDLKSLIVFANISSDTKNSLRCMVIDTTKIANRAQDLYTISYVRGSLLNTINNINRSMVSINEAHEHIVIQEMQMQISEYSKNKEEGTLSAEFMELLLFGFYSTELADFILSELSDKKLKKISCSIEVSHSNILKQIVHHLRPNIEKLLIELSTILGLCRLSRIFPETSVVIEENLINKCIVAAGAFNLKANKVLHILEDSSIKYKSFFLWLTSVAAIISNDRIGSSPFEMNQREMNLICDYLCEIDNTIAVSEKDELGQYLTDTEVNLNETESKNLWRKFLIENTCLDEYELMIPVLFERKSLIQVHKYLVDSVENIFCNFTNYMKISSLPLERELVEGVCLNKISAVEVPKQEAMLIAYIKLLNSEKFLEVVQVPRSSFYAPRIATLYFESADYGRLEIVDAQFYTNEIISVLLEKKDCLHSFFLQLSVNNVQLFYDISQPQNVFSLGDKDCLKTIENMKCLSFAVSGARKVSIIVAEDGHRVRIFEMEADDDDETTMNTTNMSNSEVSDASKLSNSEFSGNFAYEGDSKGKISGNMADDSDDRLHMDSSIVEFGDIDVNTLTMLSDFNDVEELITRNNVSSLEAELERDIAGLAIHSDNSRSTSSNLNGVSSDHEIVMSSLMNIDISLKL